MEMSSDEYVNTNEEEKIQIQSIAFWDTTIPTMLADGMGYMVDAGAIIGIHWIRSRCLLESGIYDAAIE